MCAIPTLPRYGGYSPVPPVLSGACGDREARWEGGVGVSSLDPPKLRCLHPISPGLSGPCGDRDTQTPSWDHHNPRHVGRGPRPLWDHRGPGRIGAGASAFLGPLGTQHHWYAALGALRPRPH